ncbi:hypothetical protein EUTSA_v10002897mg [Eutrema salsugineum]|uniref:RNase H type-1 domain-containing protein n=1 Tax=Eutrema salsugineum TaxID=72664 RepID=V4LCG3_EUTSA|nr:hypothetical protein EUTSA_v10002897mg [Eutrema salsugineum]
MILKKRRTGDFQNLEGDGSSKVVVQTKSVATKFVEIGVYRLYFKGLVSDQIAANGKMTAMAGFGVAICDQRDQLLFNLKELVRDAEIDRKEVEIRALVHGFSVSLKIEIRKVVIYCKDCEIYQMSSRTIISNFARVVFDLTATNLARFCTSVTTLISINHK